MKRIVATAIVGLVSLVSTHVAWSAEGMWTLDNPPLKAMQADIGWAPDHAWLDHVMHGSAKIGGGCSSSFVSKNGLVLTNHHCVAGCVGELSTATSDLLKTGFLANTQAEERKCPATEVNRLEEMSDVTPEVTKSSAGLTGNAFKSAQNAAKAKLTSACTGGDPKLRCDVVELYHGGQYKLYRYRRFRDVRLVFVPEQSMAFFGGDPDNFNFPRYDLDMAVVRVYEDGKPIAVTDYFPLSAKGPTAGEPVFVSGHPGSTQRELTVSQLSLLRDQMLIDTLLRLAEYRGVLIEYRTKGPEQARTANVDLFGVENRYKVVRGQLSALLDESLFDRKRADERKLRDFVASKPELAATTSGAWDAIAQAEKTLRDLYQERAQIEAGSAFNSRYFAFARTLVRGAAERSKPNAERLPEFNDNRLVEAEGRLMTVAPIYPDLEKLKLTFSLTKFRELMGSDAPVVHRVLGAQSPGQMAADLVEHTKLGDPAFRKTLWDGGSAAIAASDDPFIKLAVAIDPEARALRTRYEREVESVIQANTEKIAQARFAMAGDTTYPDATGTLRLSYGVVEGWDEAGKPVPAFTTIGGTFDRATGAAPFALPTTWLSRKDKLDFKVPFNVSTTNDIIGGNSGSPLLNQKGELVGLMFDGNIHSLGGAYWYDGTLNRSVAVDSAAILEALDKIYDAKTLSAELRAH
jgi:Peptidase S46